MVVIADDAVKPAPPTPTPARIVVSLLALVRFVLASMLGLALVAARAFLYLCLAVAWVISAGSAATVVALRACREGSAPLVFLEAFTDAAFKFSVCVAFLFLALAAVLLCRLCLAYLTAVVYLYLDPVLSSRSFGAITRESTQELLKFPRAVFLGLVANLAFILLSVAGILIMMMWPSVEGSTSQGEIIGSVIMDVGIFSGHAISCFVIIPALALHIWRKDQADRKAGLTVIVVC